MHVLRRRTSSRRRAHKGGVVQIKNWKPLSFDQITELPEATVGDMLSDLVQVATLRIRLYSRPKPNVVNDVKEKLLQVLLAQSHSLLLSSGCPIDQTTLAALTKGKAEWEISEDTRKKFDQWYLHQVFQHCRQVALLQHQLQQQQLQQQQKHASVAVPPPPRLLQLSLSQPPLQTPQPPPSSSSSSSIAAQPVSLITTPSPAGALPGMQQSQQPPQTQHPVCLQQSLTSGGGSSSSRTRIRTSFDPELELPKLHRWFAENQHPSRLTIQQYVRELNSLDSRRGRKPLDVNNVVYWFKNARAAHKRAELKLFSGVSSGSLGSALGDGGPASSALSNGFLPPLRSPAWDCGLDSTQDSEDGFRQHRNSNGFSSSMAVLGGAAMMMQEDSFEDDDDSPPPSPEATLDLSVRGRNGDLVKEEPRDSQGSSDMEEDEGGGGRRNCGRRRRYSPGQRRRRSAVPQRRDDGVFGGDVRVVRRGSRRLSGWAPRRAAQKKPDLHRPGDRSAAPGALVRAQHAPVARADRASHGRAEQCAVPEAVPAARAPQRAVLVQEPPGQVQAARHRSATAAFLRIAGPQVGGGGRRVRWWWRRRCFFGECGELASGRGCPVAAATAGERPVTSQVAGRARRRAGGLLVRLRLAAPHALYTPRAV
ncbi:hypothetical protein MRX96_040655 [Rhipicephalus microplus]